MLTDLLVPGLKVVVCGTAASRVSADRGCYYAGPANKFWHVLHEIGWTDRTFNPDEYRQLLSFGIGLTDVVKGQSGSDADIDFRLANPQALREKMTQFMPGILAFNGKKAAQVFLDRRHIEYGLQEDRIGSVRLFVAPSTSGSANGFWTMDGWKELAGIVGGLPRA